MSVLTKGFGGGGIKADLLWTNPSPSVNFTPQTVALDLSDYNAVFVYCDPNSYGHAAYGILLKGKTDTGVYTYLSYGRRFHGRTAYMTDTGVVFAEGGDGGSGNTSNGACIPHYIYGLKIKGIEV